MSQPKKMRLEAVVASPPTAKCKAILAMLEAAVAAHPDLLVLDIYLAGEVPSVEPSVAYKGRGKFRRVPMVFVNGIIIAEASVPDQSALDAAIDVGLKKGPLGWID